MIKQVVTKILGINNVKRLQFKFPSVQHKRLNKKRKDFYDNFLKDGDLYFDVGANYGNRIEPLLGANIKIIAIEPQPKCARYLRSTFGSCITVVEKGLSDKEGVMKFYISNAHTLSTFSKDFIEDTKKSGRFSSYNWNNEKKIEVTTLDKLVSLHGLPNFIKIDVEGFELNVLEGLNSKVDLISFEYTVPERASQLRECIDRINVIYDGEVLYNYSRGESMIFDLKDWISIDEFKKQIECSRFKDSLFGDVYARKL